MVTEEDVIKRCQQIVEQTGKRPTVRAVLADGSIRGDRGKIAKYVSQFNKSHETKEPSSFIMSPASQETWDKAVKILTDSVINLLKAQETFVTSDKAEALSVAIDSADEAFEYAEQLEKSVSELEKQIASQKEELIALRTTSITLKEESARIVRDSEDKVKAECERVFRELNEYKTQAISLQSELKETIKKQEEKISCLDLECTDLKLKLTTAETALQSKSEEMIRLFKERERLESFHREEIKEFQNQINILQAEIQNLSAAKSLASAETKRADKAEAKLNELEKTYIKQMQLVAEIRSQHNNDNPKSM